MNADLRPIKSKAELGLAEMFAAARRALPGGTTVSDLRSIAFSQFAASGLPHARTEAWRYTDLRRLMQDAKPLALEPDAAAIACASDAGAVFAGLGFRRLVIVNGAFVAALSDLSGLEAGLSVRSMAGALASDDLMLAHRLSSTGEDDGVLSLNTALARDGMVVEISPQATIDRPIHLAFITTPGEATAAFVKSLVVVGAGARATLVETHEGPDGIGYQVNALLQILVGDEAEVEHVKVTREGDAALHIGTLFARLGARATFREFGLTTGGAVVRNQLLVRLAGEGTNAMMCGASLLAGRQHADTTMTVDHVAAGGESREIFKSVTDDEARAVFQGKITVRQAAQKTDAKMMARALLLSDDAEADGKPELEIFADDVQCGHGATTGSLDDQLKFYLMARGIPEKEAEALLIQAFAAEVVEAVDHLGIRDALLDATVARLGQRG